MIQMILSVGDDCYIEHIGRKKKRDTCSLNSGSFSTASPFFSIKRSPLVAFAPIEK